MKPLEFVHASVRALASSALALVAIIVSAPAAPAAAGGSPERPDILLITVDTLRADRMSGYGYERPTSPEIDALMARGVRYAQARTIEPLTAPALTSMLLSMEPHEHGATRNGLRMRGGLDSLPLRLSDAGYRTAAFVGNWTLKDKVTGLGSHFDDYNLLLTRKRWFGLVRAEATAEDITASALEWLDERHADDADEPLFLWVHYVEPHAPYRMQDTADAVLGDLRDPGPADRYDTEVAYVDRSIGRLLDGLRRSGGLDDAIVAFTSDHGENLGEHGYWGHGRHLWEENLHVPMSITWPGRIASRVVESPALIVDLAPTIVSLVGLDAPTSFVGHDWTAVFDGAAEPRDRVTRHQAHKGAVISKHDSDLARRAGLLEVARIDGGVKELFRIDGRRHHRYDLSRDPNEQFDLTAVKADPTMLLQEWMRAVYTGLNSFDDFSPEPLDQESIDRLRSLGYAD